MHHQCSFQRLQFYLVFIDYLLHSFKITSSFAIVWNHYLPFQLLFSSKRTKRMLVCNQEECYVEYRTFFVTYREKECCLPSSLSSVFQSSTLTSREKNFSSCTSVKVRIKTKWIMGNLMLLFIQTHSQPLALMLCVYNKEKISHPKL